MRTLGIDLAAQDKETAYCAIEWISGQALVELPQVGRTAAEVLDEMERADWIGIDAPFGWPDAMVAAVHAYASTDAWPATAKTEQLRYRRTDWFVHEIVAHRVSKSIWPLSVSSDRIAVCAWRCARVLSEYAKRTDWKLDRVGLPVSNEKDCQPDTPRATGFVAERGVVEVYPAAALALWGMPHKGYKSGRAGTAAAARDKRVLILAELERLTKSWLSLSPDVRDGCIASDDAFDALVSSLVACAAATGRTLPPLVEQRDAAQREGWIHLPTPGCIESLAPGAVSQ